MIKPKRHAKLWIAFASITFFIMLLTAVIMTLFAIFLFRVDFLNPAERSPIFPIITLLFVSVIVGTFVSFFVGAAILRPITKLSEIASEVAKGNFEMRFEESSKVDELQDFFVNFNFMIQELSSIETLRNDFVANVSHEFKTPIAAIEGYATLLQDEDINEADRQEYTQMIIESSRALATLSGNILTLTKLENQESLFDNSLFRLDEQIRQTILLLETEWNLKEINLQLELPKFNFLGNEKLLSLAWKNLIGNAIKFSSVKGTIVVQLIPNDDNVIVKIADSGCGMSRSVLKHAFDKFYQGDTARQAEGNGLGLALTKRIIDLHKGEIGVESEEHEGTEFTVVLPLFDAL